jgi:hypothetical protein
MKTAVTRLKSILYIMACTTKTARDGTESRVDESPKPRAHQNERNATRLFFMNIESNLFLSSTMMVAGFSIRIHGL